MDIGKMKDRRILLESIIKLPSFILIRPLEFNIVIELLMILLLTSSIAKDEKPKGEMIDHIEKIENCREYRVVYNGIISK